MKILFTGASSFTGYWFVKELAGRGHEVHATFRQFPDEYFGMRKKRVEQCARFCIPHYQCSLEGARFADLWNEEFDLFCHHAAEVGHYKSDCFDIPKALRNNMGPLPELIAKKKPGRIVVTGSIFQGGGHKLPFSPYALSKSFTTQWMSYLAQKNGIPFKEFVIPNPFGPFEDERFTTWLVKQWGSLALAEVKTPDYVRDNIHVSLLAKVYAHFATIENQIPYETWSPSGYRMSQKDFTELFAMKMRSRLGLPCDCVFAKQIAFPEPKTRLGEGSPVPEIDWDEEKAWDELALYYEENVLVLS